MTERKPEWYWEKGLHDADIKSVSLCSLDYDVRKADPIRNYLLVELDPRNAMFDTGVYAIRFYNAAVTAGSIDVAGTWWIDDELSYDGKKYTLTVRVGSRKKNGFFTVKFEYAAVSRSR